MTNIFDYVEIMERAHKLGATELEFGALKVKFKDTEPTKLPIHVNPAPNISSQQMGSAPNIKELKAEELIKPISVLDEMTAEEILYYATPYYDQLQAEKQAHADKLAVGDV